MGIVECHRGRFLDQLLVTALDGTLAFAEGDGGLTVAQNLHLDVAWLADVALDVDVRVVEPGLGLGARGSKLGEEARVRLADHTQETPYHVRIDEIANHLFRKLSRLRHAGHLSVQDRVRA